MVRFPLVIVLVHALPQAALSTPVPLTISPGGVFQVSYRLSTGPSVGPMPVQITGDVTADVEFTGGVISKFLFLGANAAYSDTTSEVVISTFPVTAKVRVETRNIVSSLTSDIGAGYIDPLSGVISNTGHKLIQDRGTIRTRYIVAGTTLQEELRDLTIQPDPNPLVGVTTVTGSLLEDLGYKARYHIGFVHARNESRVQDTADYGTLYITENGSFSATGEVTVPGQPFATWAVANRNQLPLSLTDIHSATGQPLVLLYAFDATTGPWSPPVSFSPQDGTMSIILPAAGLRAPVRLEFSTSPATGNWTTLPRTGGVVDSLFAAGESGTVSLDLPAGGNGFVRLCLGE